MRHDVNGPQFIHQAGDCLDSEVHGANIGLTWVLSAPDGPHVGPMNLAIRVSECLKQVFQLRLCIRSNRLDRNSRWMNFLRNQTQNEKYICGTGKSLIEDTLCHFLLILKCYFWYCRTLWCLYEGQFDTEAKILHTYFNTVHKYFFQLGVTFELF